MFESLGQKVDLSDIEEMMKEVDKDGSGSIDLTEFCLLMQRQMKNVDDPKLLEEAFKIFDADGSGSITRAELRSTLDDIMKDTDEQLSDEEIDDIIREADVDGNDQISYDEFVKVMTEGGGA